jgi:tripartite-type tricarboxylate transporter receptor subunit TctC
MAASGKIAVKMVLLAVSFAAGGAARAQDRISNSPINLIVPWGPGGGNVFW